jgi:hypothetical protein
MRLSRILYVLLLCQASIISGKAQKTNGKIEILLVGTAHNYDTTVQHHFEKVEKKVLSFKPDIISIEWMRPGDLIDILAWYGQQFIDRTDRVRNRYQIKESAAYLYKNLGTDEQGQINRAKLVLKLFSDRDQGNTYYQAYLLEKLWKSKQLSERALNEITKLFGSKDSLRLYLPRKDSEFNSFIFRIAQQLGMEELFPMDSHSNDTAWRTVNKKYFDSLTIVRKDSANPKYAEFFTLSNQLEAYYDKIRAERTKMTSAGDLIRFVNSARFDSLAYHGDFRDPRIYPVYGFPRNLMMEKIKVWALRNKEMCERVIEAARKQQAKRVVVFVGAGHRKAMLDYFRTRKDVSITDIKDFL